MGINQLKEIQVSSLKRVKVNGGDVWYAIKKTDVNYLGFGEAYFSWVEYGTVKAWKKHKLMTMNLIVPVGRVKFVFFHEKKNKFQEEIIGEDNYIRLTVNPGLWYGFIGLSSSKSLVLNISNILHDDRTYQ